MGAKFLTIIMVGTILSGCATTAFSPQTRTWTWSDLDEKPYASLSFTRQGCLMSLRFENNLDRTITLSTGKIIATNSKAKMMMGKSYIDWDDTKVIPGYTVFGDDRSWWNVNLGFGCDLAEYDIDQDIYIDDKCESSTHRLCD